MSALILNEPEIEKLTRLKEYAETHPYSMDDLLDTMNNPANSPGLNPHYQCSISVGYKVVFSIDMIPQGKLRHLSVSIDRKNKIPHPTAINMIMQALGFDGSFSDCIYRIEKLEPGYEAIEVGELIN